MSFTGKRNHYNVKLLRGYGVSINVKDNRLILKNGQNDITGISDKEKWFVSKIPYEKIVIYSLSMNSSAVGGSGLSPFLFRMSAISVAWIDFGIGAHALKKVFHIAFPAV